MLTYPKVATPAVSKSSLAPSPRGIFAHTIANDDRICPCATHTIFCGLFWLGFSLITLSISFFKCETKCPRRNETSTGDLWRIKYRLRVYLKIKVLAYILSACAAIFPNIPISKVFHALVGSRLKNLIPSQAFIVAIIPFLKTWRNFKFGPIIMLRSTWNIRKQNFCCLAGTRSWRAVTNTTI